MKARFSGTVKTDWLGTSRKMCTLEMLMFVDPQKRKWVVPRWTVIDGASTPRFLWVFSSPFVGKYRRASVIHDYYCSIKERPSKEVHYMFYQAMLCDGVPKWKAYLMYQAVKLGGGNWK